jgi:hypothetical protein
MPMMRYVAMLGCLFVVVIGCGSDGGGMTGPSAAERDAARAKCETLKVTYCARVIECVGPGQITQKECGDAVSASLDCGRAVAVSDSYPTCIQALPTFSCVVLDGGRTLPASCNASILLQ